METPPSDALRLPKSSAAVMKILPMCGTYGHVHDQCPRNLQPEALAASTGSALVPPSPQLPAEPYGPWMLVEKRRSRSSTTSRTPLQHSNPTAENAAPVAESAACAPIITPAPENHPVAATSNTNSGARSKSAGVLRKHNPVVLGSRNLNILPLKPSVGASSSSSKLNKGRHVQKPLNSERHTAVTLDPVDPPISAARSVPQSKHPSTGTTLAGENLIHMDSSNTEIEAIGFSGGIWLCWFDTVRVTVLANHFQFIHCRVTSVDSSDSLLATFVYASPNRRLRYHLWHYIEQLAISIMDPWVVLGDFNATLTAADRRGCSSNSPEQSFSDMAFNYDLMDLGFSGPAFTCFPNSILHHLVRMKSDHRPLLLQTTANTSSPRAKHFKYFSGWNLHPDFNNFVATSWNSNLPIFEAIQAFSEAATNWNITVFGSIGCNKRTLLARLKGVQRCLDVCRTTKMLKLDRSFFDNLILSLSRRSLCGSIKPALIGLILESVTPRSTMPKLKVELGNARFNHLRWMVMRGAPIMHFFERQPHLSLPPCSISNMLLSQFSRFGVSFPPCNVLIWDS
ncbi:hypothetical protein V6N13_013155 [Hibiscus sabdariffa]